jgi:2,4-diketo-3-deoxy-L-fuconate hydrolase
MAGSSGSIIKKNQEHMKLFRYGAPGKERPAVVLPSGQGIDVTGYVNDFDEAFFESNGISGLAEWVKTHASSSPAVPSGSRYGSCVARPSKIICVGLNYAKHAAESKMDPPKEPVLFFKSTTALCGPNDELVIPKGSEKTDWEVELAVVIGKTASYISEEDAPRHIAGYCVHNDYSERAWQLERGGQWVKGKSADTYAPLGPWLVTPDEAGDPGNLKLWLKLNGQVMQDSSTSDLIFKVPHIVSYISQFMTLLPGDVISTGTPQGVGMGQNPQRYLRPGDKVQLGIEGLG